MCPIVKKGKKSGGKEKKKEKKKVTEAEHKVHLINGII